MAKTAQTLIILTTVTVLGIAAWLWLRPADGAALFHQALRKVEAGKPHEAARLADLIAQSGRPAEALFIRGKVALQEAESSLHQAAAAALASEAANVLTKAADRAVATAQPFPLHDSTSFSALGEIAAGLRTTPRLWEERARASFTQALAEFESVPADSVLHPDAVAAGVECSLQLKQLGVKVSPTDVEQRLLHVLDRQPDNVRAHRALAAVYIDLNAAGPAIRHLENVGRLDAHDGRPFRSMGLLYKGYMKNGKALEAYREALKRRLEPPVRSEVIEEMVELLVEQDSQQGLLVLDEAPKEFRVRAAWLALRAECLLNLGRPAEALPLIDQALQQNPNHPRALLMKGKVTLSLDRPQEALPFLERAVRLDPLDHKSRHQLVAAYRQLERSREADEQQRGADAAQKLKRQLTDLYAIAISQPWDAGVRFEIGKLWLNANRPVEARIWLNAVLDCEPHHAEARAALKRIPSRQSNH